MTEIRRNRISSMGILIFTLLVYMIIVLGTILGHIYLILWGTRDDKSHLTLGGAIFTKIGWLNICVHKYFGQWRTKI